MKVLLVFSLTVTVLVLGLVYFSCPEKVKEKKQVIITPEECKEDFPHKSKLCRAIVYRQLNQVLYLKK